MTPILVRPVREQLEHDRVIRLLQQKWRRKYAVGVNQGNETAASVAGSNGLIYPDVVLAPLGRPAKPEVVIEVETGESVNNLEAMAEWIKMGQLKAEFHLYVPTGSVDPARRLCTDHGVPVAEIWTYHPVGDQMRFTMVYKAPESGRRARHAEAGARKSARPKSPAPAAGKPTKKTSAKRITKAPAPKQGRAAKKTAAKKPAAARKAQPVKGGAKKRR